MAIAYNDVPLASQRIDQTQQPIQTNFSSINQIIAIDHEPFSSAKYGYHKALHIVDGAPATPIVAGEGSIYVDTNNIYIKNGISDAFNITGFSTFAGTSFQTVLPSGLVIKFGHTTGGTLTVGWKKVTFATPFLTDCLEVQISQRSNVSQPTVPTSTTDRLSLDPVYAADGFWVYNGHGNAVDCTYWAIGRGV